MLRTEERGQRHAFSLVQQIDSGAAIAIDAGMIGHQTYAPPSKPAKTLFDQNIYACKSGSWVARGRGRTLRGDGRRNAEDSRRCQRGDLAAQALDVAFAVGMDAIA